MSRVCVLITMAAARRGDLNAAPPGFLKIITTAGRVGGGRNDVHETLLRTRRAAAAAAAVVRVESSP